MRVIVVTALLFAPAIAFAAPVATASEDVDGDGTKDPIELAADGVISIGGKQPGRVELKLQATSGRLDVGQFKGRTMILAIATTKTGSQAAIVMREGGAWRESIRFPLGGVGLDADYALDADAVDSGVIRYQTRAGIRRCDGKPAYVFAEGFDPGARKFTKISTIPSLVPASAPTATAKLDPAPFPPPVLYTARFASHQIGSGDVGGLGIPTELDDGKPTTLWREELSGSAGEGQFFTFETRIAAAKAKQLRIVPGNPTNALTIKQFNRPRTLAIVGAKAAYRVELPDAANEQLGSAYVVDLPAAIDGCVTVILESTYGPDKGQTAIAELSVFADGERAGGGDAMLARVVAQGGDGEKLAAAALVRRGAPGATALEAEVVKTTDPIVRRRLIAMLVKFTDTAAVPSLVRAVTEGWVSGQPLIDVVEALANNGMIDELGNIAARGNLELEARIAAVRRLSPDAKGLPVLIDLVGMGPHALRRMVIERLTQAPLDALVGAAARGADAASAGDLWRATTRRARLSAADRPAALTAMLAALPAATDYERRYRLVDGIATLGDTAALRILGTLLAGYPAGTATNALRQVAILGAASVPRGDALALVLGFARDPDPGVRIAVVSALANETNDVDAPWHSADGPDGIDRVIITALSDTWPEVRRRAANALGSRCQRGGPARALVDAIQRDQHLDVRGDALIALVQCQAAGTAELLPKIWDDAKMPIELRTQAVGLAVALGDPKLGSVLVVKFTRWRAGALESAEAVALAVAAAASIARLDAPNAAQVLYAALDDIAFPEIVSAAATALGALGPKCPAAAKAKLEEIGKSDEQAAGAAARAAKQCGR